MLLDLPVGMGKGLALIAPSVLFICDGLLVLAWKNQRIVCHEGIWEIVSWNGKCLDVDLSTFAKVEDASGGDPGFLDGSRIVLKSGKRHSIPRYMKHYRELVSAAEKQTSGL